MKVNWTSEDGKLNVEFEVEDYEQMLFKLHELRTVSNLKVKSDVDLFETISELNQRDVFAKRKMNNCGKCGSDNVHVRVRENDGNKYYELLCCNCWAKLSFGQHKNNEHTLFARSTKDGEKLPDYGWLKWNKETGREE